VVQPRRRPARVAAGDREDRDPPERVPDEHDVAVGGAVLHVLEWGPDAPGRTVLLVHGYSSTSGDWLPVVPGLRAAGLRVLAVDLPGHGRSSGTAGRPLPVLRLAGQLRELVERLDLRDVVLVGHSLGGIAVLAVAGGDPGWAASRLHHLVTLGGTPMVRRPPELGTLLRGLDPSLPLVLRLRPTGRAFLRLAVFGPDPDTADVDRVRARWSTSRLTGRWSHSLGNLGTDLRPLLARIPVPVTAVVGSTDRVCPPSRSRLIADGVPSGRLRVVEGAGHVVTWERPRELTEVLLLAAGAGPTPG